MIGCSRISVIFGGIFAVRRRIILIGGGGHAIDGRIRASHCRISPNGGRNESLVIADCSYVRIAFACLGRCDIGVGVRSDDGLGIGFVS